MALLESGTEDLSLRQVARAAGVSAMAPYRHFSDKSALLRAVAEHGFELLREELNTADHSAGGREALIEQGLAYVAFAMRHPALFRLMFTAHCAPKDAEAVGSEAYDVLARRVESLAAHDPASATLACWAIVHGLATLSLDGRVPFDTAQARSALQLLAGGFSNQR